MLNAGKEKSRPLKQDILNWIRSGEIQPENRLPSIQNLAERYHLSYVTVQKALAELEREGYLLRRNGVGVFVRKQEKRRDIRKLAVPLRLNSNPVFARFYETIADTATAGSIPFLFGSPGEDEVSFIRKAAAAGCDAMVRFPGPARLESQVYEQLKKNAMRTVILNDWWQEGGGCFPCVRSDEGKAMDTLLERLYELGHRHVALVQEAFFANRFELEKAFSRWQTRHGMVPERKDRLYTIDFPNRIELLKALKAGGYTAVCFSFDLVALKLMELAGDCGFNLSDLFCIAGFDDIPEARECGLTTVRHDCGGIVREAFRILSSPDYHRHEVSIVPAECVFRQSVRPVTDLKNMDGKIEIADWNNPI